MRIAIASGHSTNNTYLLTVEAEMYARHHSGYVLGSPKPSCHQPPLPTIRVSPHRVKCHPRCRLAARIAPITNTAAPSLLSTSVVSSMLLANYVTRGRVTTTTTIAFVARCVDSMFVPTAYIMVLGFGSGFFCYALCSEYIQTVPAQLMRTSARSIHTSLSSASSSPFGWCACACPPALNGKKHLLCAPFVYSFQV